MKYYGSVMSFTDQRNNDLLDTYRRLAAASPIICLSTLMRQIVDTPSQRFWVSEERASVVVSAIAAGRPVLESMIPTKREMFLEIYRRVMALMEQNPSLSRYSAICEVVNSPAPKFYMAPDTALCFIRKQKKKNRANHALRLTHKS